jgi:DNA-binding beta-propeller fold protein YncE
MTRKRFALPLAVFTILLGWMAFRIGTKNRADLALAQTPERRTVIIKRDPVRVIEEDPYSTFSGIALDEERGEVLLSNDNGSGQSIEAYHVDFPASRSDRVTEPLRKIAGPKTDLGDICGLAISPEFNEIFKVSGEGNSELGVFPIDANGDVEAVRWLPTSHGAWGVFLERKFDELFVTIEHVNRIAVYRRTAQLTDDAVRFIQGPKTELADPHGIYVDLDTNEIYVANHGHWHSVESGEVFLQEGSVPPELKGRRKSYFDLVRPLAPSTGKFLLPSITVYARTAHGDVAPLRVIRGAKTGLNLPLGVFLDTVSRQIVVANGGDDALLFFDAHASGDVAPVRVIKGSRTELGGPTGVTIDRKRNEIWVANWNNHTATVYARTAAGNVAPLRVIRSSPKGAPRSGFGSPGTVAYNPKRDEILVPN